LLALIEHPEIPMNIGQISKGSLISILSIRYCEKHGVSEGNALALDNGNIEYDLCGLTPEASLAIEVTIDANPQTIWNMSFSDKSAYRSYRVPSLSRRAMVRRRVGESPRPFLLVKLGEPGLPGENSCWRPSAASGIAIG
jgi:hypothetical protein